MPGPAAAAAAATARSRLVARLLAPLVVAAGLAGAAVVTVERAGCDDPGRYETVAGGPVFVPGCLLPEGVTDRPVAPSAPAADPARAEGPDARRG